MMKQNVNRNIVMVLAFVLSQVVLFGLSSQYNSIVWTTCVFSCLAYVSQLILIVCIGKDSAGTRPVFNNYPAFTFSYTYLILQFVLCIIFAITSSVVTFKVCLLVNLILFIIMLILIFAMLFAKNMISQADKHQKNHHTEL